MKKFFVDLYEKFIHLSWVEWTIAYCKDNIVMASIIGGVALAILILLFVIAGKASHARKAKKILAAQTKRHAEEEKKPEPTPAPVAEKKPEPVAAPKETIKEEPKIEEAKPVEPAQETPPAPIPPSAPVEEKAKETPKAEEKSEPVKEEKPEPKKEVAEEKPVEEKKESVKAEEKSIEEKPTAKKAPAKEKTVVEKEEAEEQLVATMHTPTKKSTAKKSTAKKPTQKQSKAKEVEEAFAMVENMDESVPEALRTHYEEDETEKAARYKGKWVICRVLTDDEDGEEMYFFELRASNGEKLLSSEEYTSYQGALRGIQTHKTNILKTNFKITLSKKGDYIFKLLSGKNMLLCMGENYPTKARCDSAIESTIRFAATAIIDENVQDIVVKVPKEDDTPIAPLPDGYNGKWVIYSKFSGEDKIYYFELYANNGEKLLSSEEYTTYIGAVNGIQTHKKNIEQDNFRISLTKRGDYIYKLLNGNGQLLCLGEHYRTKRLCQNAVDSVKRFAISSPLLTEEKDK